ncbi:MAG TPA: phosphate ABC transporter permease subunit PstC [Egibacteraceae bacterium]|nr:phosphate ABC transporter permease subunit PstC [Actinomycetota bacterium]HWB71967.1 phosphate ABC transporter permease subunit PstC [Egibacteraceae bacterium]
MTTTPRVEAPGRPQAQTSARLLSARPRPGEKVVLGALWLCGALSILTTVGIVVVLFVDASVFFRQVSIVDFLSDTAWHPFGGLETGRFGVLPLVTGTLLVTAIAVVLAVPLGLGSALYLSEYAPTRVRRILKPILEILAGVPTVVLGFFALLFVTPLLRALFGVSTVNIFNAASAGIVMGIMIMPTIASLSEDALSAVPGALREGAYGLGATKRQVALKVVTPAALSGVVAAIILGMGRAIGETMIVAIAAGNLPTLTANPFSQIQTMTAYIVQAVGGESPRGTLSYQSIFAVGALLFLMTFALNVLAQRFVRRFREVY